MKKFILLITMLITSTVFFASEEAPVMKFWVFSDIHSYAREFELALNDAWNTTPGYDALILNGDVVDLGQIEDYDKVFEVLNRAKDSKTVPEKIEFNIGNHEYYYSYGTGPHGRKYTDILQGRYLEYSNRETFWNVFGMNGIGFISLGSEVTYNKYDNPSTVSAKISDEQLEWFKTQVKEYSGYGRPTFVFLHQPLDNTVYFSKYYRGNVDKDSGIKKVLQEYPNMFYISSHSHETFYTGGNYYQDDSGYTCVDSASVARTASTSESGNHDQTILENTGQTLLVEVYVDKVVFRGRDFIRECWCENGEKTIKLK